MKFFNRSCCPKHTANATGQSYDPEYTLDRDEKDLDILRRTGSIDRYGKTQQYKDICSVSTIVSRFVKGDTSAINEKAFGESDLHNSPKDLMEMFTFEKELTSKFNALPAKVREKYGNSLTAFASAVTSGQFAKDFSKAPSAPAAPAAPAVPAAPSSES